MRKLLALLFLLTPILAFGQTNPSKVAWTYEVLEYPTIAKFELGYFIGTTTTPAHTQAILPTQVTLVANEYQAPLVRPAYGTFTAKLRACNSTGTCSDWSEPTSPFTLSWVQPAVPTSPAKARVIP